VTQSELKLKDSYDQHEREMLVGAFLDIYGNTFTNKLKDDESFKQIPVELHGHLAYWINGLLDQSRYQVGLQHLALMSDQSLHALVHLFGEDPFSAE